MVTFSALSPSGKSVSRVSISHAYITAQKYLWIIPPHRYLMVVPGFLSALGEEIEDPETETFLLFAHCIPSQNLGYVDKTVASVELSIAGRDFTIQQSPTLLSSNRPGGTTGAVLWKITPLFAEWLINSPLMTLVNGNSTVLELGCGISGVLALLIGPKVGHYIATDQEYVFKLLHANLDENATSLPSRKRSQVSKKRQASTGPAPERDDHITVMALDWETSVVSDLATSPHHGPKNGIDVVIACDCIYNEALIQHSVNACAESSRLRSSNGNADRPTICVIAQQLRSDLVFGEWLSAFHRLFRVWRIPDDLLTDQLKEGAGFCVHVGILRES